MPRVTTPTSWDDATGRRIYLAIAAGDDPFALGLSRGTVSWYLLWMHHLNTIVFDGPTGIRLWDDEVDPYIAA